VNHILLDQLRYYGIHGSDFIWRIEDKAMKYCIMNFVQLPQVGKQ